MINIISSCTNSKKHIPSDSLKIAYFKSSIHLLDAINLWNKNIESTKEATYEANTLYKGNAWQATLNTNKVLSAKFNTNLYIASAGYGLIHAKTKICSYDSTFASSTINSINKFVVPTNQNANIEWWNGINKFDMSSFSNDSLFFIVLPYEYLYAAQDTIKFLIEKFKENVFIFVANKNTIPDFMQQNIIKFDSRFNSFQTGIISNMLQRAVLWLSNEIIDKNLPLSHKELQQHIETVMKPYKAFNMPVRSKLTEEEIRDKVKQMIIKEKISSATKGLKIYRNAGFACEQKRFGKIFKEVKSELS